MRQSEMLVPTLREAPAEADAAGHRWLLRSGMIRQLAAGIYSYLPLGRRILLNVERIVREEMDRAGCQEVLLPIMQPAELWEESGRYTQYGPELMRLKDRHAREFALGPTHEEVVTALARDEVNSYRKLPFTLYQIGTKFRDERRPRFGLLRGREFIMKDAYSFASDWEELDRTYQSMNTAYSRILERCGLEYIRVEADAGTIGGQGETHEFMALADVGEDTIVTCKHCGYAANLEKAGYQTSKSSAKNPEKAEASADLKTVEKADGNTEGDTLVRIQTPGVRTINELSVFVGKDAQHMIKTLLYQADGQLVAALVRGDHEVNDIALKQVLGAEELILADETALASHPNLTVGFLGPIGLDLPIVVDADVAAMEYAITGANEIDVHYSNVVPGKDFALDRVDRIRFAAEGDGCPTCGESLVFTKGIEVGHIFKLGTKYSDAMGASFLDRNGRQCAPVMGCYGIGVSRLMAAIAEQYAGEDGIRWPAAIAPYHVHLIAMSWKDEQQRELTLELEQQLVDAGYSVLIDDRDERPGVKFKDSELIGLPVQIVIGRGAAEGQVEFGSHVLAAQGESKRISMTAQEAVSQVKEQL
ncbi:MULTISPECIES: proline--tRNA ligase [unclassified Paenibacillus]|uniref:proline--tRNA ligase n=1 Tax=unclassified Paenibacillus TaxID=185978 RepID=UPI0007BF86D2|nr:MULTISPECIES: proline--tRNA ligase [unclassified Paenibacillus]SLK02936.1 prolyl-tRNA synthetase [Paenibacillus sp. RU5A]SOC69143.1 prolyl-tRNA synthetase [Paenibacillus sp. RU26A]SOC71589.1 prolyl-tRNA synthetase [Paenibacillus sp. RU5M]